MLDYEYICRISLCNSRQGCLFYPPDQVNEKGETPLHRACIDGKLNMVKALIEGVSLCYYISQMQSVFRLLEAELMIVYIICSHETFSLLN